MCITIGGDWAGAVYSADGCPGDCVSEYLLSAMATLHSLNSGALFQATSTTTPQHSPTPTSTSSGSRSTGDSLNHRLLLCSPKKPSSKFLLRTRRRRSLCNDRFYSSGPICILSFDCLCTGKWGVYEVATQEASSILVSIWMQYLRIQSFPGLPIVCVCKPKSWAWPGIEPGTSSK